MGIGTAVLAVVARTVVGKWSGVPYVWGAYHPCAWQVLQLVRRYGGTKREVPWPVC